MVDHVKTLLLNLPAASADGVSWEVDQSFVPVQVPSWLSPLREALFVGVSPGDVESMGLRVDAVYRVLCKPELASAMRVFDPRTSGAEQPATTVFGLYAAMRPAELDAVGAVLGSGNPNAAFRIPDGMPETLSSVVSALGEVSKSTPETVLRFASAVLAYAVQLEFVRLRGSGRVSS